MKHLIVLIVLLLLLPACASKKVVVAKNSCRDLVVLGTVINTHWECEK